MRQMGLILLIVLNDGLLIPLKPSELLSHLTPDARWDFSPVICSEVIWSKLRYTKSLIASETIKRTCKTLYSATCFLMAYHCYVSGHMHIKEWQILGPLYTGVLFLKVKITNWGSKYIVMVIVDKVLNKGCIGKERSSTLNIVSPFIFLWISFCFLSLGIFFLVELVQGINIHNLVYYVLSVCHYVRYVHRRQHNLFESRNLF